MAPIEGANRKWGVPRAGRAGRALPADQDKLMEQRERAICGCHGEGKWGGEGKEI